MLSRSLYGAFFMSKHYIEELNNRPAKRLSIACKLRSPELFRDSMIYLVGNWDIFDLEEDFCPDIPDPRVKALAERLHAQICVKICSTNRHLQRAAFTSENSNTQRAKKNLDEIFFQDSISPILPQYYRCIVESEEEADSCVLSDAVEDLLENNLTLRPGDDVGTGNHACYFLCAEIKDQDLPVSKAIFTSFACYTDQFKLYLRASILLVCSANSMGIVGSKRDWLVKTLTGEVQLS